MTRFMLVVGVPFSLCLIMTFSLLSFVMIAHGTRQTDVQFAYLPNNIDSDIRLYDTRTGLDFNLTNGEIGASFPRWSPDGERLIFNRTNGNSLMTRLYEINADGTHALPLLNGVFSAGDEDAVWSPDETQIAFMSTRTGTYDIYVYDTRTRRNRRLTVDDARDISPAWSPDGTRLAFTSDRDGNDAEIYVLDMATQSLTTVTDNWVFDYTPVWVDANRLVYASSRNGSISLFISYSDGTGERALTPDFSWSAMASSISDGRIIFSGQRRFGDFVQVYLLDVDSGALHRLTHADTNYFVPAWRP